VSADAVFTIAAWLTGYSDERLQHVIWTSWSMSSQKEKNGEHPRE
jgi:hypothetical protein